MENYQKIEKIGEGMAMLVFSEQLKAFPVVDFPIG